MGIYISKRKTNEFRIISDHLGNAWLVVNSNTCATDQRMEMVRFGARDYDAETGRWTTKAPIGFSVGLNYYAYVGNDPILHTDPLGLKVSLCSRKSNLPWPFYQFEHWWIKTDKNEAGMGATPGQIPGQGNSDFPYTPTQTVDHSGQSKEPGAQCTEVHGVNESCVDSKIEPGKPTGSWMPTNTCGDFAFRTINACSDLGAH
jgi:RHS repeat-associated protein